MLVLFAEIEGMRHCAARDLEILGQPWPAFTRQGT
jgi:hypothetical protein